MAKAIIRWLRGTGLSRSGQTMVEYALILVFISLAAIAILVGLGSSVVDIFTSVSSSF